MTALIEGALADNVTDVLLENTGVAPATRQQLTELLESDPALVELIVEWGANDTEVRGKLADLVVRDLGVRDRWPSFADNADLDVLCAQVDAAARLRGWAVRS